MRRRNQPERIHCNGGHKRVLAVAAGGLILATALLASNPAQAAPQHHHRHGRILASVDISTPQITTIADYKHRRSLIRISMTETTNSTPRDFHFFVIPYKWGIYIPGKPYKHGEYYDGCGHDWDHHCAWLKILHDLAPPGHSVPWVFDMICNRHRHEGGGRLPSGRFYIRTAAHLPGQNTLTEYFPTPAPHLKQPDRKHSYLARCPHA